MEKIIGTYSYGLCVFSMGTMTDFLKEKKIRSKKVLELLAKLAPWSETIQEKCSNKHE